MYDVVIIGAGIAGLAAGHQLKRFGVSNLIVLEAQDYVGGRIKTSNEWGRPIELGAEIIHGEKTITADTARMLSLDYVNVREDIKLIDATGTALSHQDKEHFYALREYVLQRGRYGVSVSDIIERSPLDCDDTTKQLVHRYFSDLEGEDTSKLDSGTLTDVLNNEKYMGDNIMLKDGYQQIVDYYSHELPISLNSPVSVVQILGDAGVAVTLASGEVLRARKVIVTVSLGVLKDQGITFIPELPEEKRAAIAKLGMGNNIKLFLRFKEPHNVANLFHYGDGSNGSLQTISNWWASASNPSVLVGYCGGSRARAAIALQEDRLIEKVLQDLGSVTHDRLADDLVDYKIARWDDNPFIRGSYSYHPVHARMEERQALAKTTGATLFWAGEATCADENYATVHGAILSGLRAAAEALS